MGTVLDMANEGVDESSFALLDEEPLRPLAPASTLRKENARLSDPCSTETVDQLAEPASKATITAALRRELREARKDITVSACIALATTVVATGFGLLSVASGVMFLVGSWIAHGLAYRRLESLLLAVTPKW
ncbi:MAG: hypothetical protein KDB03_23405 [Planctomycetales bacterium]|nr:hypothetical protein [Planctomycetales bacterium]